ncbi:MAG: hypothetical protein KAT58_11220 [candidate division Zixibacteria bacterium]|nr:hypothetical protein [candidate division Zixibacteria bacterium]
MNRVRYILLLLMVVAFPLPVFSQTPEIALVPDQSIITLDSNVVVNIVVSANSVDLKSFSLEIAYDRIVMRTDLANITEGPLLGTSGVETFFWVGFTADSGTIYIDGAILGDGITVDGGGVVATIKFYSLEYGISDLEFIAIRARDADNMPLYYNAVNDSVRVCQLLGDVNEDNWVNIADVVYLLDWIFDEGPEPIPNWRSGEVDCNGYTNIADVVYLIYYIFAGGPPPCQVCVNGT